MEINSINKIFIDMKIDFNQDVSDEIQETISNKILEGLEMKLGVFYDVEKLINKVNLVKAEFKLKRGAQSMMPDTKMVINDIIVQSLGNYKELVNYTLNVEVE